MIENFIKFVRENWFKIIIAISTLMIAIGYLWSIKIEQHREDRLTSPSPTIREDILKKYGL